MGCFGVVLWLFWSCAMAVLQPVWLAWGWQAGLPGWLAVWLAGWRQPGQRGQPGRQPGSPVVNSGQTPETAAAEASTWLCVGHWPKHPQ
jgi:hypothetical protein